MNVRRKGGGTGGLDNSPGEDGGGGSRTLSTGGFRTLSTGQLGRRVIKVLAEEEEIPEEESWLSYKLRLRIIPLDETAPLKLMPPADDPVKYRPKAVNLDDSTGWRASYVKPKRPPLIIQHRAQPTYVVVLEGEAVKVAHTVTPPVILAVGGADAIPWNRDGGDFFEQGIVPGLLTPLTVAAWRQTYVLTTTPVGSILPPETPLQRGVGEDNVKGFAVGS